MSCTQPITVWQALDPERDQQITFKPQHSYAEREFKIPCGSKCDGCLISRSMQRAVQIYCELVITDTPSYFITLTFNDENMPPNYSLDKSLITKAIKLMRKKISKFRFFQIQEYGGSTQRPHGHMVVFGLDIPDLELYREKPYLTYTSQILSECWPHGHVELNLLTIQTCIYIAQHDAAKILKPIPYHELKILESETGEFFTDREPESKSSSNRPGIGHDYYQKYKSEIYTTDSIVIDAMQFPVPKYFDTLLKREDPKLYEQIKQSRIENADIQTPGQLAYQAKFNRVKLLQKKRDKN